MRRGGATGEARGGGEVRSWTSTSIGCGIKSETMSGRCATIGKTKWTKKGRLGLTLVIGGGGLPRRRGGAPAMKFGGHGARFERG